MPNLTRTSMREPKTAITAVQNAAQKALTELKPGYVIKPMGSDIIVNQLNPIGEQVIFKLIFQITPRTENK